MRILEVYDAELHFFVTVITLPTAHEACATIHLTGGECNAQTCMHVQVISRDVSRVRSRRAKAVCVRVTALQSRAFRRDAKQSAARC